LPPGVAAQVDADSSEGELIVAYGRLLLGRPDLAAQLGSRARAYIAREHTLEGAAAGYMRFLAQRYGWGDVRRLHDQPLWEPTNDERRTTNDQPAGLPEVTSLPKSSNVHRSSFIVHHVAEALAGMGATEDDLPLLEDAARAMAELCCA
jgi:hypothetical protein